ncbi:hypothetical protein [Spirosoma aerolatum]|nr:hypothetical protein [Spirosoma aerolatum]
MLIVTRVKTRDIRLNSAGFHPRYNESIIYLSAYERAEQLVVLPRQTPQ